ncbi:alpha-(1,3)-fucosyltransferase 10-like [Oncorhynchus tshawytscha]|uniref:alpha-(1,3)-fucosyltransferase 10-like n=1 Tax=Oncorhynchus tshawytscha TaxID=74940 RepID=UPI000D099200|nr:alpha-(1,3)-fucosyltransferase 10-like [Oncorhynchus tshawytscha]
MERPPTSRGLLDTQLHPHQAFAAYDIVIHSEDWEDHLRQLRSVLASLEVDGLTANPKKCHLGLNEAEYLGYTIGSGLIKPQVERTRAIREWLLPWDKKGVRSFLGLTGYYRWFIPNYNTISTPLTNMTKKRNPLRRTGFNIECLPLPRREHHQWALFHEESPKFFHEPVITLFNHTATFSQYSQLPLTSQHLENLEVLTSQTYLVSLNQKNELRKTLAPVVYVQSDCDPPSDRDAYVSELMKHIRVDSYGQCLHNKDLPSHLRDSIAMEEQAFYQILAQYKFILAFENAVCDDYITEKLWRPLKLGVVPVYYSAPKVQQWLPSSSSAVVVFPDEPPEKLSLSLKRLAEDDGEFDNMISLTELVPKAWQAEGNHLKCPLPRVFDFASGPRKRTSLRGIWTASYEQSKKEARALHYLAERNRNFPVVQYWKEVFTDSNTTTTKTL